MASPCTAAHTARPRAGSCERIADFDADGIRGCTELGEALAIGQLRSEHQPRERRPSGDEAHIGRTDLGDPVALRAVLRRRCGNAGTKFRKSFDSQFDQQRFMIGEMAIGRRMTDASTARDGTKAEIGERPFFEKRARRLQQRVAQVAVMIAFGRRSRIHDLSCRNFSMRANRLDVSHRLPPIASTSA